MAEYKIVTDRYSGFEVQVRHWWFPIWLQAGFTNTHSSVENAERFAERHALGERRQWRQRLIKYLGELPVHTSGEKPHD